MSSKYKKNYTYSIVAFILAILFIFAPSAHAANLPYDNPNKRGGDYKINLNNIVNSATLTAVVGCTGITNTVAKAIQGLFGDVVNGITGVEGGVTVSDPRILDELKNTEKRNACLDGLAYSLAKTQLASMTKSTMNWINTGFQGDPMFARDIQSLTDSIEKGILNDDVAFYRDSANRVSYPYGREFALSQVVAYRSAQNFKDSLKSDLNEYVSNGTINGRKYENDFSALGGWNGWLALTQHPQNNPIGFFFLAKEESAKKQQAAINAQEQELAWNSGYLSQKKCIEYEQPADYTETFDYTIDTNTSAKCLKYETVTPGSTIKDKISVYINSPERQLELADSLNESLNALFSGLLSGFQTQGLSSLGTRSAEFSNVSDGPGDNHFTDAYGNTSTLISVNTGSGFSSDEDEQFDLIRSDLSKIIQTQKDYIYTIRKGSSAKRVAGSLQILPNILYSVGKLDYCIPGPNPNYKELLQANINEYYDYIEGWRVKVLFREEPKDGSFFSSEKPLIILEKIVLPSSDNFEAVFEGTSLWKWVVNQEFFSMGLYPTVPISYIFFKGNPQYTTQDLIDNKVTLWEKKIKAGYNEYVNATEEKFGPKSKMQNEFSYDANGNETRNPEFLEMSRTGLAMTKRLPQYAEDIAQAEKDYDNIIGQTNINISKLNRIKKDVDAIVLAAQKRRDAKRISEGKEKVDPTCRDYQKF